MFAYMKENHHLLFAYLWVLLAIPSVLWWKESIIFVILLSLYANFETSLGAHHAQKAERANEKDK